MEKAGPETLHCTIEHVFQPLLWGFVAVENIAVSQVFLNVCADIAIPAPFWI